MAAKTAVPSSGRANIGPACARSPKATCVAPSATAQAASFPLLQLRRTRFCGMVSDSLLKWAIMPTPDSIDIADPREYAWLLERSDTLLSSFAEVWNVVPIAEGSVVARVVGIPLRFLAVAITIAMGLAIAGPMVLAAAVTPVATFALVEPWVPDLVWWIVIGAALAFMAAYTVMGLAAFLHTVAHGDASGEGLPHWLRDGLVAAAAEPDAAWDPDKVQHVSHTHARTQLFAASFLMIGVLIQCGAVAGADRWFTGPIDNTVAWALFFARSLFDTALLGIPAAILPPWSAIGTTGLAGDLLMVAVDVFFAAGALTLFIKSMGTALRPRELFHGTTRDLADYLHASDISGADKLTIHRVAVLRPLDEAEVVTIGKADFFRRVTRASEPSPATEAPSNT